MSYTDSDAVDDIADGWRIALQDWNALDPGDQTRRNWLQIFMPYFNTTQKNALKAAPSGDPILADLPNPPG